MNARELIELHAHAFENGDWDAIRDSWDDEGELVAPSGRWAKQEMPTVMEDLISKTTDIGIEVTTVFASAEGDRIAAEWTYSCTRRSDGERSSVQTALLIDLRDGLVLSWREYFDLSASVEFVPPSSTAEA